MNKKSLLLLPASAFIFVAILGSASGPGLNGNNRTGAGSTPTPNCAGGCHSANNTNTQVSLVVLSGSTPVTSYMPGQNYTIAVAGNTNVANLPKFGFQFAAVKAATITQSVGTLSAGSTPNIAVRNVSGMNIMEHTTPLNGMGGGNNWAYVVNFNWTAPAAGTGPVKMYLTLNAVNGDNNTTGDAPNHFNVTLNEEGGSSSIGTAENSFTAGVYPNPVSDRLHISLEKGNYAVDIFDLSGRNVWSRGYELRHPHNDIGIPVESWAAGIYQLRIVKGSEMKIMKLIKN